MASGRRPASRPMLTLLVALTLVSAIASRAGAARLIMKDGRVLEGNIALLSSMAEDPRTKPAKEGVEIRPIVLCDDNLRRTFVARRTIQEVSEAAGEPIETFHIRQPVARNGLTVLTMGPIINITPFDEFGRRTLKMGTGDGVQAVIQGITELTPQWAKLESLSMQGRSISWDQRIATSTIPREVLAKILAKQTDPKKIEHRLKIVRMYLQGERYKEAEQELKAVVNDFPESKQQYAPTVLKLRQAYAKRILAEIRVRHDAGQHGLVLSMLNQFPAEDVAGETLQAVRQLLDEYKGEFERGNVVLKHFDDDVKLVKETAYKSALTEISAEIHRELNINTLNRLAAYQQLWDDDKLTPEDRVALAVSGWLAGSNDATRKLAVAVSLFKARNLVQQYLVEPVKLKREVLLASLRSQEGSSLGQVAKLLDHMKPPLPLPEPIKDNPGLYQLEVEVFAGQPTTPYLVQLPPEYDAHRRYPAVVTLHGAGSTPEQQIDWWAGSRAPDGSRLGQATRNGYIVIAPVWAKHEQKSYNFSAEEHAAVLNTLRDACRRFAIDTDRVFLSGHSMGGDATWDLGLAHPDLWAGIIPIAASSDKYVRLYWENAKYLPFYLVNGELDGRKSIENADDLNRYLKHAYNATIVEYQGRGHEHFSDEILRLFDWMSRYERNFFPKKFEVRTMREWDNYFWWVELADMPARCIVAPETWPPPRGTLAVNTEAAINAENGINIRTGAARVTVWLSPEMVDLTRTVKIMVNGSRLKTGDPANDPDLAIMLEDARTRGDRRHPFWGKVVMTGGRASVAGQ
jgi:predicted esterase